MFCASEKPINIVFIKSIGNINKIKEKSRRKTSTAVLHSCANELKLERMLPYLLSLRSKLSVFF